jgi:hypothetical protein
LSHLIPLLSSELGIGMGAEGPLRSVGNTLQLHESAVVEACNLKFAIEYQMKNGEQKKC